MFELGLTLVFLVVAAIVVLAALFFWGVKHALALAANSVLGFFALYGIKAWLLSSLVINIWSVLLIAVFGIFGLILVLILHLVGVWF